MHGILLSCLVWWEFLDKLQKRICRAAGPLGPLTHRRNVASLSFFCRYYFGEWSSKLAELVSLPSSLGPTCYSHRSHDFLSPFLDVTRMFLSQLLSSYS